MTAFGVAVGAILMIKRVGTSQALASRRGKICARALPAHLTELAERLASMQRECAPELAPMVRS